MIYQSPLSKICDSSIVRPLCLIYKECVEIGDFPMSWKKANVFPIHKKESRQPKKLPANISVTNLWEIFEEFIFDVLYKHFNDNNLLTPNQSGFRQGDSTVNKLLYILLIKSTLLLNNTQHMKLVLCLLIFLKHSIMSDMTAWFSR